MDWETVAIVIIVPFAIGWVIYPFVVPKPPLSKKVVGWLLSSPAPHALLAPPLTAYLPSPSGQPLHRHQEIKLIQAAWKVVGTLPTETVGVLLFKNIFGNLASRLTNHTAHPT